jgi:hypothetical protein
MGIWGVQGYGSNVCAVIVQDTDRREGPSAYLGVEGINTRTRSAAGLSFIFASDILRRGAVLAKNSPSLHIHN